MAFINRLIQYRILIALWLVVIAVGFVGALLQFWQTLALSTKLPSDITNTIEPPKIAQYQLEESADQPFYSAKSVWIYDRNSQEVLFADHANTATAPASLVKLMTALVVYENTDLDEIVKVGSAAAVPGNRAKFLPQDEFTVRDLLTAMLVFSANDAGEALAKSVSSPTPFIDQMNHKAKQLGLENTQFANVTGLDDTAQFSTAEDLGRLADHFLDNPFLATTVSQELAMVKELNTGRLDTIYTTNSLLQRGPEYLGIKTGTTDLAGQNLIFRYRSTWPVSISSTEQDSEILPTQPGLPSTTSSKTNLYEDNQSAELTQLKDLDLIVVILGSQDRYGDALNLIPWLQKSLRIQEF